MKKVKHFRGEWHGDDDIPRIEAALKKTHVVHFDRGYPSHGDIIAEPIGAKLFEGIDEGRPYRITATGKKQWIG